MAVKDDRVSSVKDSSTCQFLVRPRRKPPATSFFNSTAGCSIPSHANHWVGQWDLQPPRSNCFRCNVPKNNSGHNTPTQICTIFGLSPLDQRGCNMLQAGDGRCQDEAAKCRASVADERLIDPRKTGNRVGWQQKVGPRFGEPRTENGASQRPNRFWRGRHEVTCQWCWSRCFTFPSFKKEQGVCSWLQCRYLFCHVLAISWSGRKLCEAVKIHLRFLRSSAASLALNSIKWQPEPSHQDRHGERVTQLLATVTNPTNAVDGTTRGDLRPS